MRACSRVIQDISARSPGKGLTNRAGCDRLAARTEINRGDDRVGRFQPRKRRIAWVPSVRMAKKNRSRTAFRLNCTKGDRRDMMV
jgi:hypothetical protein